MTAIAGLALPLLAGATPAAAGDPPPAPGERERPPPRYETTVKARRPPRSASDWTLAAPAADTAPRGAGTAAELLPRAPGLHISQHGGAGKAHQIFLRGFDAVHGQDVALSAGGIPINEVSNVHGQGYADLQFLIPEAVLRMRVLEGAFDPRQGDFAVAGSVDFDLGMARRGILSRTSVGRFGALRTVLAWAPRAQPRETFFAVELARGDGFGPDRAWRRANALAQALVPLGQRVQLRLLGSSHAGRFAAAGVLRQDDYGAGDVAFFDSYDHGQGGSTTRHQLLAEVRYRGGGTRAALSVFALLRDLRLRQNFTGFTVTPQGKQAAAGENRPQGDLQAQQNDSVTVGGRGRLRRTIDLFGQVHALEGGVIWRHDRVQQAQQRLRAADRQPWLDEVDARLAITDLGLYADLELVLPAGFRLRGGLRADALAFSSIADRLADSERDAFGFHVGPKATLEWRRGRWLRLFASYGKGFRSPQALSLGQGESAPFTTVHAGELGARLRWRRLATTVAGFVTHVAEDRIFDHVAGRTEAVGATTRGGVTLRVEARPWRWLHGTFGGTWARAVLDASGEVLPYAPPLVLRLDLDARRAVTRLWGRRLSIFGALAVSAVGPRPLPFGEESRAAALVDLGLGVELPPVTVSVEAFNLADARWRDGEFVYISRFSRDAAASLVPARHFTAGRPLTVQGTLALRL